MTKWILRSKRKKTGGLLLKRGKKKKHQRGRDFLPTHIGETKVKALAAKGGNRKRVLLSASVANVSVRGKAQTTKITSVVENPADSQFTRRNIVTKGAVIQTEMGKARVTSRPGQNGFVNAVLLEDYKEKTKLTKSKKA
jgi:small subunit ribosomal protein S8e